MQLIFGYDNYIPIFGLFSALTVFFFVKAMYSQTDRFSYTVFLLMTGGYYFMSFDNVEKTKKPAMIVCPGGGYGFCSKREAEVIAMQFTAAGYHAFLLNYAIAPKNSYPEPQNNLSDAIALVRKNAEEPQKDSRTLCRQSYTDDTGIVHSICSRRYLARSQLALRDLRYIPRHSGIESYSAREGI